MTQNIKEERLLEFSNTKFYTTIDKDILLSCFYDFLQTKNEVLYGPECANCGTKDKANSFLSEAWMQVDINKNPGPIDLIWICPDCIAREYNRKVS